MLRYEHIHAAYDPSQFGNFAFGLTPNETYSQLIPGLSFNLEQLFVFFREAESYCTQNIYIRQLPDSLRPPSLPRTRPSYENTYVYM